MDHEDDTTYHREGKEHTMVTGAQFKMNLFCERDSPYINKSGADARGILSEMEGIKEYADLRSSDSTAPLAPGRLTVTPDTDYTELSEGEKAMWLRVQGGCSAVSGQARLLYGVDNIQGVDLNPEKGRIEVKTVEGEEFIEEDMVLKDPENKTFELKNIESFHLKAVNAFTGGFAYMSIENGIESDLDGSGKAEKGMLCTFREGAQDRFTGRSQIISDMKAFMSDNAKTITLIEDVANPVM